MWLGYSRVRFSFVFSAMLLLVISCGGGGGGSSSGGGGGSGNGDPDVIPDPIGFSTQTTTEFDTWVESNSVTVTGINQQVAISVVNGEYSIDGAAFTSTQGSISANQTVVVRTRSASTYGVTSVLSLNVGGGLGVQSTFEVTTALQQPALNRVANASCVAPANPGSSNIAVTIEAAFPNLSALNALVGLYQAPGDSSRWYAVLQSGEIYWFDNNASASSLNLYADLSAQVNYAGEAGLLGMAFDPDFANNGYVYVSYFNNGTTSVISRLTDSGSTPLSLATEEIVLSLVQPAANHNGGTIAFGPDGYLYIGFGDGGGADDEFGHGQNTQSLHSNILRIDVSSLPYTIPADNPFIGVSTALDEIYAYGLRNPWRWSFDQQNGDLWVADVGQNTFEEVNKVQAGDNLGWPIMEASACFSNPNCSTDGLVLPVAEYGHGGGDCSVTGGYVYRGSDHPAIQGVYFYGDFCTGRLFSATQLPDLSYQAREEQLTGLSISSFAQDSAGEVYVLNYFGGAGEGIYKINATGAASSNIPTNLSDTGCFASTNDKSYPDSVIPYDVTSQLWSDGALKTRLFAIPDGESVEVLADGDFEFPTGSILIKNFTHNDQFLETRLFMRHNTGWAGYSYRWLGDQSDAVLVDGNTQEIVTAGSFEHIIPTRGQCFECHTNAANNTLGLETSQLNKDLAYPNGNTANQLGALVGAGFVGQITTADLIAPMAAIDDDTATLETRARSYLHSNCSGCHRPGAQGSQIDLRINTALANTNACDIQPQDGDLGINDPRIIYPGDASQSVLIARMASLNSGERMPPVATQVVDDQAVSLVSQWINSLANCN
ncbi:hypothetical protein FLL45_19290 [Aliikangiella marina]|uniref:Glucose/Sorbosone dehydrogenase domain-containing protein n=1 Tax=Aliikangiella marina TaxID=1712262 RepID=A0A545T536_9GAMM|nr:PQQ-dependent sugar dehydrogenase [Aliikangiella marina]TQV72360.1 hypothetical protein FLL45_19290 [Aliikangiella marina]